MQANPQKSSLRQKVVGGAIWTLFEKMSTQVVQFVVGMVLARLLLPDDYGTIALTYIFFSIANVLIDNGFGGALIQKKDADDLDFNSVFYLQVSVAVLMYCIMFFAAPWIASFYKTPELVKIVRVSSISFIFHAFNAIQGAELTKKMLFHLSFRISLPTSIASAVTGITLAFMGYGVWALVIASLVSGFVGVILRWFVIAWRPRLMFSFVRLKPLWAYGWKMAVSSLLDNFFKHLNGLLIGKFYTRADLAFVNKGRALPNMAMNEVDGTLGRVSFPALVKLQDDRIALREAMRRMMMCSTFLVFPLMVGIAACAKSELLLLYGEKWVPATPYMMIACLSYAFWPFHTINLKGILALGRSDVFLKLEIIKKILRIASILVVFRFGVLTFVAVGAFVMAPLSVLVNSWPNRKLLDYPIRMQIMDVLPTALICCVEAAVVFGIGSGFNAMGWGYDSTHSNWSLVAVLLCQTVAGAATYFSLAYAFRLRPLGEYVRMLPKSVKAKVPCLFGPLERRFG